jgi:hypothetical protein
MAELALGCLDVGVWAYVDRADSDVWAKCD